MTRIQFSPAYGHTTDTCEDTRARVAYVRIPTGDASRVRLFCANCAHLFALDTSDVYEYACNPSEQGYAISERARTFILSEQERLFALIERLFAYDATREIYTDARKGRAFPVRYVARLVSVLSDASEDETYTDNDRDAIARVCLELRSYLLIVQND